VDLRRPPRRPLDEEDVASLEGLGSAVSQLRRGRGDTREAVAKRAGLTGNTITDIEEAKKQWPTWGTLRRLAKGLGVGLDELVALALDLAPGPAGEALRQHELELSSIDVQAMATAALAREEPGGAGRDPTGALPPGERRLAVMAAEGMTNSQIAEALSVSLYSAEASLSRLYRKLGIRNRHQQRIAPQGAKPDDKSSGHGPAT
jgi:transcriptional regulator with XRE-family HTH domain/DNA-binding CsgD family transcriptional regulator